jgi:aryl-alcohol dehydrogenase-like predicted oxidoreductase
MEFPLIFWSREGTEKTKAASLGFLIWKFGNLEIWKFGNLEIWKFVNRNLSHLLTFTVNRQPSTANRQPSTIMEYTQLGKSDLKISRIGFGTMSLETESPASERLVQKALEEGINYFDTADLYQQGAVESLLGRAFRRNREQVILATKVGNQWRPNGSGWDWNPSKEYILDAIDQSLRRLQTDHIDLYQLHGGTLEDPIEEIIETFERLKNMGKIRYYGISSIRPNVIREYANRSSISSVMMQYSLIDRRPEEEMLSYLKNKTIGVLARGSLAKGMLVSKPPDAYLNYSKDEVGRAQQALKSVSDQKYFQADRAVHFALDQPAISSVVIGIRTEAQLMEAVGAYRSPALNPVQLKTLQDILPPNFYTDHR